MRGYNTKKNFEVSFAVAIIFNLKGVLNSRLVCLGEGVLMNASSWLDLRLTGVFTSDSLIFIQLWATAEKK